MNTKMNCLNAVDFGASGSSFSTIGRMRAGSYELTVEDIGDFQAGQTIQIGGGRTVWESQYIFGPHGTHANRRKLQGEVEVRHTGEAMGNRIVYILDIDPACPEVFRWTDDRGRHWQEGIALDREWHPLSGGVEIRFGAYDWSQGWVVTLVVGHSFTAKILDIRHHTLTLDEVPETDVQAMVSHNDTAALQTAIDAALAQGMDLYLPAGHYTLTESLLVKGAESLTILGASPYRTVLDIGDGGVGIEASGGSCLVLEGGREVEIRDLRFQGSSGFEARDQAAHLPTRGASGVWGFYFMKSNALSIWGTSRVYVENCHAEGMSAECFYSASASRRVDYEPETYTTSITYLRCSVEDCARNAFNNNDMAENTHIIDCRVRNVGGNAWEGASRFVEIRGCYIRNAGPIAIGNVRSRKEDFERLGTGQHIVTDNTFESGYCYGNAMIAVGAGASQVILRGNNFVNFNGNGVDVNGQTGSRDLPPQNVLISGNIFQMTAEDFPSRPRTAITVSASDVTVSDNQIYSTIPDENLCAIRLRDDAQGILIHDNLLRGCGQSIVYTEAPGIIGEVIDERHFLHKSAHFDAIGPSLLRRRSHRYRGWLLLWEDGSTSIMEDFDPESCVFTLREPHPMQIGRRFTLKPQYEDGRPMNERLIHHNIIV